jgi:hypothetical protein
MERYITKDLIRYVICDYVSIQVLQVVNPKHIRTNRVFKVFGDNSYYDSYTHLYFDNVCVQKKLLTGILNIATICNYNNKNEKHGWQKKWDNNYQHLISKALYKNGIMMLQWNSYTGPVGTQGPMGAVGMTAVIAPGVTAVYGFGAYGNNGHQGPVGAIGVQGPQGPIGDTGSRSNNKKVKYPKIKFFKDKAQKGNIKRR